MWSPLRSHAGLRIQVPESFQILVGNFNTELAEEERASETQNMEKKGSVEKYILCRTSM